MIKLLLVDDCELARASFALLVHVVNFRIRKGRLEMQVFRHNRATGRLCSETVGSVSSA